MPKSTQTVPDLDEVTAEQVREALASLGVDLDRTTRVVVKVAGPHPPGLSLEVVTVDAARGLEVTTRRRLR